MSYKVQAMFIDYIIASYSIISSRCTMALSEVNVTFFSISYYVEVDILWLTGTHRFPRAFVK